MRTLVFTAALAVAALAAAPASADVQLSVNAGRVTISAKNATVGQILAEWARVGQTKIVNAERIPSVPMTIELANVPEREALQVLLRSVSGYVAAPRAQMIANASQFDRILVMPTSSPARPASPASPAPGVPTFQQPQFTPPPPRVDDDDDGDQPVPPGGVPQVPRGPVFNTFPAPRIAMPQNPQAPVASPTPTAPVGVSTPGMAVPVPQQPGQQGIPGFPGQPGAQGFPNSGVPGIAVPNSPNRQPDRD
jgi:hypothetical protein